LDDLAEHDCLVFTSRTQRQPWRLRHANGDWVTVEGRSRPRLDNGEALRDAALAGPGIAYLPGFLVDEDLMAERWSATMH
jgi:DNA-binding transcriptional LysR family regulator